MSTERRRGLPGDTEDLNSRYIEAQIGDLVIGSLYLPNNHLWPDPRFDEELAWFSRL